MDIIESYLHGNSSVIDLIVEGVRCGEFLLILENFRNAQAA